MFVSTGYATRARLPMRRHISSSHPDWFYHKQYWDTKKFANLQVTPLLYSLLIIQLIVL